MKRNARALPRAGGVIVKIPIAGYALIIAAAAALTGSLVMAQLTKADVPGIANFSRIDGMTGFGGTTVGLAGTTDPSAMPWLKSEGFVAVVNLRLATEEGADVDGGRAAARAAGLKYLHLPFDDEDPDPRIVDDFLAAVGDEANQPVYIHCNSATRVAALWMIARVLEDGWEIERARNEVESIAEKPPEAIAFADKYIASHGR